ncbi:MAG: hypothetical protein HONBIEJF_03024 [Fimbriimonadaceae bacterium]|nr:hypothetical protein [Fimbriimonadaceae bacterium]
MKRFPWWVVVTFGLSSIALPQEKAADTKPADKQEEKKKDPKVDDYEKAVKELTRIDGPFVLYQRKKDILLELPEERIGKLFLFQATLNSGAGSGAQAGDPLGIFAVEALRWEKKDDFVWIVRPNFQYRWMQDDPLAVASKRSFPEAILGGYRIEQTNPEKKLLLVNVTALFQGDLFQLSELVNLGVGGNYSLDRDKSGVDRIKSFGDNTIVRMFMHYQLQRGPGGPMPTMPLFLLAEPFLEDRRSAPLYVSYNLWYRKDSDYRPRFADQRVGYFTQDYYNVERFLDQDRKQRLIMRYDLRKKNPTEAVSEPVKPIVWYLDTSIPDKYKDAVRDGILMWNKAFEPLGYRNAVVVKEADPKDPDWDHADARHNVFRWTMSPNSGYAVALFRTDPYTGEVLNAGVTFDAGILAGGYWEHEYMVDPASDWKRFATKQATGHQRVQDVLFSRRHDDEKWQQSAGALGWKMHRCDYGRRLAADFALTCEAVTAIGKPAMTRDELARQLITNIVSHEVGHCLGLRHNFVSSTNLTTAQLANADIVAREGTTASVMDYVPSNTVGVLHGHRTLYSQTIGKYDIWAIRYGYEDIRANSPQGERPRLNEIARLSGEPGHAFMTDEDADLYNPFVMRFDNARNSLDYFQADIDVYKRVRRTVAKSWPKSGQNYSRKTQILVAMMMRTLMSGAYASMYVGGIDSTRQHKGDVNQRPTLAPVSADGQRRAVELITGELLTMGLGDLSEETLLNLSRDYNDESSYDWIAPLRSPISSLQSMLVASLLQADTLHRIAENQFKLKGGQSAYTMTEHYHRVVGNVFKEVSLHQNTSDLRRDLQQFTVQFLIAQARSSDLPSDASLMSRHWLRRIFEMAVDGKKSRSQLNQTTRIHFDDMADTIQRFLNRQVIDR